MAVTTSMASSGLAEVLDRILDKGLVIDAWVKVSVLGLELLTVEARVVVAGVETYLKYAEAIALIYNNRTSHIVIGWIFIIKGPILGESIAERLPIRQVITKKAVIADNAMKQSHLIRIIPGYCSPDRHSDNAWTKLPSP